VGGGFWSAKAKIGLRGLIFGPIRANRSANSRGSACGGVGVVVEAIAHRVGRIERGAGFN
jgi:hypothetical protein